MTHDEVCYISDRWKLYLSNELLLLKPCFPLSDSKFSSPPMEIYLHFKKFSPQISKDQNKIETAISQYEKPKSEYNNKSVKYYSAKRNREIASDFDISVPSSVPDYDIESYLRSNSTTAKLLEEIQEYKNLTTIYNEFRTGKKFKCTNVIYNNQNGRISSMYYEEI